ncbi:antA/AntB antirepressor family protein [Roseomonas sp. HJA6]|uniref:AntA/AntB antirepressor family protein n=1 Tax=Roseomonas alba TaxID=2846776 RepID=A0ABS7A472_9PROT|nr:antA/AntB antirepressor family protein [Neoroseomonas alba]
MQPHRIGEGPVETIAATKLHTYLEVGKRFTTWVEERIETYGFADGVDYIITEDLRLPNSGSSKARPQKAKEYYLTLDMAKELAMV